MGAEVSRKLELEQDETKPTKQQPSANQKTPVAKEQEDEKLGEISFGKADNINTSDNRHQSLIETEEQASRSYRKSRLTSYDEQFLAKAILQVVAQDKKLENLKNNLAICEDFTIAGAYKILINDSGKEPGSISKLQENTQKLGIFFTHTELNAVFKRFDANGDEKISYHEFEHTISPISLTYTRLIRLRTEEQPFTRGTLNQLIELIRTIGSVEFALEDLRVRLSHRVSLEDAFRSLDNKDKGFVDIAEFKNLLAKYGIYLGSKDIQPVHKRIDLNEDGMIVSQEFTKTMSPWRHWAKNLRKY